MKTVFFALLVLFAAIAVPCGATSNYTYKKGEYVKIVHGLSPARQYSLATHGEGEDAYKNFHVYLMREPTHKKIGPLTEIGNDILDTAADRYRAFWSPTGRYVAILYRSDRHVIAMNLYRIERGRAFPISGYDLVKAASKQVGASNPAFFVGDWQHNRFYEIRWQTNTRFSLKEEALFYGDSPQAARAMKPYGKAEDDKSVAGQRNHWANMVSVDAVCQVGEASRMVKIASMKPGTFTLNQP